MTNHPNRGPRLKVSVARPICHVVKDGFGNVIEDTRPPATVRAEQALAPFISIAGDDTDGLIDLLTDLRHWADKSGADLHHALDVSYTHYLAERAGK